VVQGRAGQGQVDAVNYCTWLVERTGKADLMKISFAIVFCFALKTCSTAGRNKAAMLSAKRRG
jgi:hypothetical protein